MATYCKTCGDELHPDRAEKYDYCTKPDCRRRNARALKMAAVAVNKAADQFVVLNDTTEREASSGRYKKQPDTGGSAWRPSRATAVVGKPAARGGRQSSAPASKRPWTDAQEELAFTYRDMGLAPDAIAKKLGITGRMVTQILLSRPGRKRR